MSAALPSHPASVPGRAAPAATEPDQLKCELTLHIAGTDYKIPGGQVKSLALELLSHGFSGALSFVLADDEALGGPYTDTLLSAFVGDDLIKLSLQVYTPLVEEEPERGATPLALHGLVSQRWLSEQTIQRSQKASRVRRYELTFLDPAQLLWKQHFPCALYTGKTWQDVIEAHKGEFIQLSYDWDLVTAKQPHVFLGHEPGMGAASFYDFVLWLADTHGGFFSYDYAACQYRLTAGKPPAGPATRLHASDVAELMVELPVLPRHAVRVHNSFTEQAQTMAVEPAATNRPVTGVQKDYLLRTPMAAQVDARVAQERKRLDAAPGPLLHAQLRRWPQSPLCPGSACPLRDGAVFLASGVVLPAPFADATTQVRALTLTAQAVAVQPDDGYGAEQAPFQVQGMVLLDHDSEQRPPRLSYVPPDYPRLLEGKIVSEEGAAADETYQIYEDSDTSAESYKVQIPLFAGQQILVDFQPLLASGHFYFPAYKNARVLVAVDLARAWLVRYLDWRGEARLPKESQGNQLLVGKTPKSGASLQHVYEEDKPVFRLQRTNDKDTQLLEIGEGHLLIQVKEAQ